VAILTFLLAVLAPTIALALWFRVPVSPQRLSTLVGAAVVFEAYRLGNAAGQRMFAPRR